MEFFFVIFAIFLFQFFGDFSPIFLLIIFFSDFLRFLRFRLHIMKQQYETKLLALEQRILATQEERDKVLKAMEGKPGMAGNSEKMTKIKSEYQDKLGKLQGEVKKLKTAQKEHAKLLRNQAQYEKQVEKLKSEVRSH